MRVKVLFFGIAHDVTGFNQELADCKHGERLADLRRNYERRFPRLGQMAGSLVAMVNQEMAEPARLLKDGDEVAFLPPVSGGRPVRCDEPPADFYRLTCEPIPTQILANSLKAPQDGAIVVFEGIVRNHSAGRQTLYLDYEAYEPMAVRKMREVGEAVRARHSVDAIGMIHRLGRLEIGETSVAIFVASAHRHAAFDACHEAINLLKQTVPIWKKEYFEDGGVWAEGEALVENAKDVISDVHRTASSGVDRKREAEVSHHGGSRSRT